jgi:putative phage-type endonuclease
VQCEQRTPEWFQARAGRLTGSVADAILATLKSGGEPAARRDLRVQLAIELITGMPVESDGYINREMQRGIDLEPAARSAYEAETGRVVRSTGFIQDECLRVGCSLDGDVDGLQGIIELKCPKSATHIGYLKRGGMPSDYVAQVTHNLWVTGAAWCDFVSFDDRLPEGLQFFRHRVERHAVDIKAYEAAALKFLSEVEAERDSLLALKAA